VSTSIARARTPRPQRERKPRWLRARVWLNRRALDLRLAEGALPASSPELDYRAEQLLSSRCRRQFATGIKRIIEAAEEPASSLTASAPVRRQEILAARCDLLELAELIRHEEGLQVRGLALIERFLTSAESPLFHPSPEETLERTVRRIRAALLLR
jgi:hypothetical protein